MNLDFSEEQKLLQRTVRDCLTDHAPLRRVREAFDNGEPYDRGTWRAAADLGWLGVAVPEEFGGSGFGYLELAVIAEELGRAIAPIPFSSSVYLASEAILRGGDAEQCRRHLPGLASGERIGTFAFAGAQGSGLSRGTGTRLENGRLRGSEAPVPDGNIADLAVVAARGEDGAPHLVLVELAGEGVNRKELPCIDASRPHALIEFDGAPAEPLSGTSDPETLVSRLVDGAIVLMAFEQLGGAQACLDMALAYAKERFAFGRPIGSFQAMKHRMADMYTNLELARSNCYYGGWALSAGSDELPVAACIARISATDAYSFCAEENIHVHGGAGCTWEYDCHLFLRRSKLLAYSLGAVGHWKQRLIERLAETP
ncbi:MAG: acyl-CoA/acyl-ACP dehydrogenase [Rhodospirillaceae bacterium]|nr:acyl-CoA/acyl-ACP dehydrogenase [Rhodospirillaceae bacterium]